MKLTVERGLLLRALSHMQSVVEKRQTIPVLSNVLIETHGDSVLLKATDNEIEVTESIPAGVETAGSTTVSAHKLYDIVKKLPEGAQISLSFNAETSQLAVVCGRSRFALATISADGFPTMQSEDMPFNFTLKGADLLNLISKTGFAVSLEETRYNLNGIYFHEKTGEPNQLCAVATDGHRLACAFADLPEGAAGMPGVIIPRKTIGEVSKLVAETDGDVSVSLSTTQIRFGVNDVVLASRLIDGTYPEYEKVIPTGNDKILEADVETLTGIIDRVSVVSEKSKGVKVSLSKGLLHVSAVATDEGSAEDEMEAAYEGDNLDIGFNYRYLLDILAQMKGGNMRMTLLDNVSPVIVESVSDAKALFVLMPMRV